MLSPDDVIESELAANEVLVWSGRPPLGLRLRASDAAMIPFSLMWGGFAIFWESSVVAAGAPIFFMLWGIPFVLVGLYMIAGRFFVDAEQRRVTTYAVTNERILIVSGIFDRKTTSLDLTAISNLSLTEFGNGGGTITFGQGAFLEQVSIWGRRNSAPVQPEFFLSDSVRDVYERIREAQRAAKQKADGGAHRGESNRRSTEGPADDRIRGELP